MIKELYLKKSMHILETHYKNYNKSKEAIMKYGLEIIYVSITKLIPIILLSMILGLIKETLFFILMYNVLRTFAFGMHAKKSYMCLIASTISFIILPYLSTIIKINLIFKVLISIICFISFLLYSPADTEKRPIINKKKRLYLKIVSTSILLIYIFIIFLIKENSIINIIMFSMLTETTMILPISYKLFDMPYRNYVDYLNKNGLN